jgi:hypothetical protein
MSGAIRTNRSEEQTAGEPPPASPNKEQIRLADGPYQRRSNRRSSEGYADRHVCRDASEEFDQRILDDTDAGTPVSGTLIARADRRRTVERRESDVPSDVDDVNRDVPMAGFFDREPERAQAGG